MPKLVRHSGMTATADIEVAELLRSKEIHRMFIPSKAAAIP